MNDAEYVAGSSFVEELHLHLAGTRVLALGGDEHRLRPLAARYVARTRANLLA